VRRTIPDAIRILFNVDVAKDSPLLKSKAMSMVRNGLIKTEEELIVHRKAIYLADNQEVVLFNALVLNAIFPDPKIVKEIFTDRTKRISAVQTLRDVLLTRTSLCGIALSNMDAIKLVSMLDGNTDLYTERLPNPFQVLPQVVLGKDTNLMQALLVQASVLEPSDSILMAFINGDIELAYNLVKQVEQVEHSGAMSVMAEAIKAKYKEASEFDDLLDFLRPM
jgi:hypothetical protein